MRSSILTWAQSLVTLGRNYLNNVKNNGCKSSKRASRKPRECASKKSHGKESDCYFGQRLRAELHHVVDSIQPRDALADIQKRIQGGSNDQDIPRDGNQDR
jgi:hypothetical protein